MSLYSFVLIKRRSNFLNAKLKEDTFVFAYSLAQSSKPWVLSEDMAGLTEIISGYKQDKDLLYIVIFDNNGKIRRRRENYLRIFKRKRNNLLCFYT